MDIAVNHIPLFIEPVKFETEKVAIFKLSDNVNNWSEEIITHINEDIPFLSKIPYEIVMKKIDKELGYGLGSVVIKIPNVQAAIPIIINKKKLSPLDVLMIGEEEAMPLTEDSLLILTQKNQSLGKMTEMKNSGLVDRITAGSSDESGHMPPNYGKYTFGHVYNANQKDIDEFNELIKEARFIAGFKAKNLTTPQLSFKPKGKISNPIKKIPGSVVKTASNLLHELNKTGSVMIVDQNNNIHKGIFVNDVRTLDGEKVAHKLFISKKGYSYQEKIAGKEITEKIAGETNYSINDDIVIITNGYALEPMKVLSKTNGEKLACVNHLGQKRTVFLSNIGNVTKTAAGYLVPKKSTIIKIGSRIKALNNDDKLVKLASAKGNKTYVTCIPECNSFSNEKIGTFNNLSDHRFAQVMNGFYSNGEELIKQASGKSLVLTGIDYNPVVDVKKDISKIAKLSVEDSLKLAANLTSPESVDAVLSLGFINEQNVNEYVEMIPELEEVVNHLAKILINVRLGMPGDEAAIRHAMKYLQKVIDGLKGIN